jgi:hypothetical protein
MANSKAGRRLLITVVALGLMVAWRMNRLESTRPSPHGGGSPSPAASAGAVQNERHDLSWDEQQGGHTLARHVGRSDRELAERLEREGGIAAASTFDDRATAERVVSETLRRQEERVASWLRREKENMALDYRGSDGRTIGRVLIRGASTTRPARDARVVLRKRGGRYFVLTAYPVEP